MDRRKKWELKNIVRRKQYRKDYYQSPRGRYSIYKNSARDRELPFEITFEQFCELTVKNCVYCNFHIGRGLDRIDSNQGYLLSNIVPCCTTCNLAKNDLTKEEFLNHIKLIYESNFSSE